jgi:hypothetical protein
MRIGMCLGVLHIYGLGRHDHGVLQLCRRRIDDPITIGGHEVLESSDLVAQLRAALRIAHANRPLMATQVLDLGDDVGPALDRSVNRVEVMVLREVGLIGVDDEREPMIAVGLRDNAPSIVTRGRSSSAVTSPVRASPARDRSR